MYFLKNRIALLDYHFHDGNLQIINKAFVVTNMRLKETSWRNYQHPHSAIQNEIIILMSLKIIHLAVKAINHTSLDNPLWLMNSVLCRQERAHHLSLICRLMHIDFQENFHRLSLFKNISKTEKKILYDV